MEDVSGPRPQTPQRDEPAEGSERSSGPAETRLAGLENAFIHMEQGLAVFGQERRLILCNERYVQMYSLTPELVRPGASLRELIDHRIKVGSFSGNRDQYIADLLSNVAKGKIVSFVREHEGRFINISNRPMDDGGWVATHEDITEQRMAELQRTSMQELENRRTVIEDAIAGFRERVESGRFRGDLLFRLAVVEVELPPLRRRADDVLPLAFPFASQLSRRYGRPLKALSAAVSGTGTTHCSP